jgi:putative membrane protein
LKRKSTPVPHLGFDQFREHRTVDQVTVVAGWAILAASLVSPLCNLSVALFSARVAQHMLLTLVAAPLIILGQPERMLLPMLSKRASLRLPPMRGGVLPIVATAGFAASLWTWHLPGSYDATLRSDLIYWSMHVTTLGSALLLWHALFHRVGGLSSALLIGFGTTIQMSLLSALLTLAPRPLFESHFGTTWPWGLSPLEDQQLGGAIMWALGGTLFTVIGVLAFGTWLKSLSMDETTGPAARAPDLRARNAAASRSNANTDVRQPCRGSAASGCGP